MSVAKPREYLTGPLSLALLLGTVSGVIHGYFAVAVFTGMDQVPFYGMAAIYLVGVVLIAANVQRDLMLKVGLGWVVLLLVLWALVAAADAPHTRDPLAFADKAVEVVLLAMLLMLRRQRMVERPVR